MSGVIVDTSVWIDFFAGRAVPSLEEALAHGLVVLSPLVVAELVSGARRRREQIAIAELLQELPLHQTPLAHWIRVGELRRGLRNKGISVSTPDAHVAQCALDRDAVLLSRDAVFANIARLSPLRVHSA
ncbi:MAG: PIN domain-containing protein [Acidobacteria bacterium]|nr:PIN domain-containing protein [Acidobacteriota bacterium]